MGILNSYFPLDIDLDFVLTHIHFLLSIIILVLVLIIDIAFSININLVIIHRFVCLNFPLLLEDFLIYLKCLRLIKIDVSVRAYQILFIPII